MASINSLFLILSTLAPYQPENSPVTYPPNELSTVQNHPSFSRYDAHSEIFPDKRCNSPFEWYTCSSHCPRTCERITQPCEGCVPGCDCIPPLVRGPDGNCIPPEQCEWLEIMESEKECEPEEEMSCYSHCEKNCTNYDQNIRCPIYCVKGCVCKEPKIRGPDGTCILPQYCPSSRHLTQAKPYLNPHHSENEHSNSLHETLGQFPRCSGENEVWMTLPPQCPDDCYNYENNMMACKKIRVPFPKCVCQPGFVRGPNGNCIRTEECPKHELSELYQRQLVGECPENEEYRHCGSACQKNCTNYNKDLVCSSVCVSGCFCKDPMVRGPNGNCVYKEECRGELLSKIEPTCPEGEYYKDCEFECSGYGSYPCECEPGCYCKHDMKRGPDGKCQPRESFERSPSQMLVNSQALCPEDQVYLFCGPACLKNCSNFDKDIPCIQMCSQGCFCEEPKILGPNGKCIFPEECPLKSSESQMNSQAQKGLKAIQRQLFPPFPTFKCGENEKFSMYASICPDNCKNYNTERLCKHIYMPGCKCKNGYVFGDEGTCIKVEECTVPKPEECQEPEYYDECGSPCETDCYNFMNLNATCEAEGCKKGCFCRPGWVRSADWKCVLPADCPSAK